MITGSIKRNSHTQQLATQSIEAVREIICILGITKDDWNALMFEFGMLYLYNNYSNKDARNISTSVTTGFWDSWIELWADDDFKLLEAHSNVGFFGYDFRKYIIDKELLTQKEQLNET